MHVIAISYGSEVAVSREYYFASFCAEKGAASVFPKKDHKFQKIFKNENFILHLAYQSDILKS